MTKKLSLALLISCVFTTHNYVYATKISDDSLLSIAYLQEKLKASIDLICYITNPDDLPNSLKNFFFVLEDNEKISSRALVKQVTLDALTLLKKAQDKFINQSHFSVIADYLSSYLTSLNDGSMLSIITGKDKYVDAQKTYISNEGFLDIIDFNDESITREH